MLKETLLMYALKNKEKKYITQDSETKKMLHWKKPSYQKTTLRFPRSKQFLFAVWTLFFGTFSLSLFTIAFYNVLYKHHFYLVNASYIPYN